jgi:hypothetical protein
MLVVAAKNLHMNIYNLFEIEGIGFLILQELFSHLSKTKSNRLSFLIKGKVNEELIQNRSCDKTLNDGI